MLEQKLSTSLVVSSSAFENGQSIPEKYTCDGVDINPSLNILGIDASVKTLAIIVDDPDAPVGNWVHWVKFNIPVKGESFEFAEGIEPEGVSGLGTGKNLAYEGPCPPDKEHRYFFKVYALDAELSLGEGATKEDLEKAMEGHILQKGELVGVYDRAR